MDIEKEPEVQPPKIKKKAKPKKKEQVLITQPSILPVKIKKKSKRKARKKRVGVDKMQNSDDLTNL